MYYFLHGHLPDVEFFASRGYIHVLVEVPEEYLFDNSEAPYCGRVFMQQIHGTEAEN